MLVECLGGFFFFFYLGYTSMYTSQLCALYGSHHFSVVFQSVCAEFSSLCSFHPPFPPLYRATQIQINFISIADTGLCWQSVASSSVLPSLYVCVHVFVCACMYAALRTVCTSCGCYLVAGSCWASPVHQSMSPPWVGVQEQPCPLRILAPPSVSTHPPLSLLF